MPFDLPAKLPQLLSKAIEWAEAQSVRALAEGTPLDEKHRALARSVGVAAPENIRILELPHLPVPEDKDLQHVSFATGFLGANTSGLALGHGILICEGHRSVRVLSHQFRHVHQCEQAGSLRAFLEDYIRQLVTIGYREAPLELDAYAYERARF